MGNHRPISLTSVLRNVMEQVILTAILWYVQDNEVIRLPYEGQLLLTSLISLYGKVISG